MTEAQQECAALVVLFCLLTDRKPTLTDTYRQPCVSACTCYVNERILAPYYRLHLLAIFFTDNIKIPLSGQIYQSDIQYIVHP